MVLSLCASCNVHASIAGVLPCNLLNPRLVGLDFSRTEARSYFRLAAMLPKGVRKNYDFSKSRVCLEQLLDVETEGYSGPRDALHDLEALQVTQVDGRCTSRALMLTMPCKIWSLLSRPSTSPAVLGCKTATVWRIHYALWPAAYAQATLSEIWRWRRRGGGEWLAQPSVYAAAWGQPVCGNYMPSFL